jgi:hypothetical protein
MGGTPTTRIKARPLTFILAILVLITSSVANVGAQGATPGSTPVGSGYTPFRFEETQTITLMTGVQSQEAGPPPEDWEWLQLVRDELNIDVQITWITDASQYTSTLRTRAAANDLPDVFQTDLSTTSLLVQQGLVADWLPFREFMPTYVRDRDVEALAEIGTFDGKQYGLVTKNPNPFKGVIAIRGDWLENLGLEAPKTTDEFLAVAQAFTTQDPDGNGAADTYGFTGSVNFEGFIGGLSGFQGSFGDSAPWQVVDDGLLNRAATEEHRQYLEFVSQVQAAGVMDPDWVSQEPLDSWAKWKAGRIGIIFEDWCALFCVQGYSEFKGANPTGSFIPIDPPVGPTGLSMAGERSNAGSQYGLSQRAVDEGRGEAVARLLEWINGPGYIPTAFGEEGRNWERDENGNIVQNTDVAVIPYRQMVSWAYVGSPEELRARYGSVTTYPDGEVIDVYSILERCAQYPINDTTQWASMPPPPPATYADYIRTQAEGEYAFLTGQRSFEEWDAYVESLNAVGLAEWTAQAEERARELGIIP